MYRHATLYLIACTILACIPLVATGKRILSPHRAGKGGSLIRTKPTVVESTQAPLEDRIRDSMDEIVDVLEDYEDSHGNHPIAAIDVRDGSVNLRPQPRPKWRPMEDDDDENTADNEAALQRSLFRAGMADSEAAFGTEAFVADGDEGSAPRARQQQSEERRRRLMERRRATESARQAMSDSFSAFSSHTSGGDVRVAADADARVSLESVANGSAGKGSLWDEEAVAHSSHLAPPSTVPPPRPRVTGPMPPQEEVFRRLQEKMDRKAGKKKKRSEQRIANSITDAGAGMVGHGGPHGAAGEGSFPLDGSLDLETMLDRAGVSAQHAAELGLDTLDPTDPRVEHALARLAHAVRSGDKDRAASRGRRDRPRSRGDLALEELVGMVAAQPADEESVVRREVQRAAAARRVAGVGSAGFGAAPPPMSEREMQIRMRARKALRNKGNGGGEGGAQHRLLQAEWTSSTGEPGLGEDGAGGGWRSGPGGRGAGNSEQGQGLDPVAAFTAKEKAQYKARMEAQREAIQRAEGACLRGKVASGKGGKAAAGGGMQVRVHGATGGSGGGRRGQEGVKVRLPGGNQHRD